MAERDTTVRVERSPKRVRAFLGGHPIFDTVNALLVWEHPYYPHYYIPAADVQAELVPTGETRTSRSRGEATVYAVRSGQSIAESAAWFYPQSPVEVLRDHVRFDWNSLDQWFEEDEEVFTHPRDPYTRVDILATSRRVRVAVDGVTVADSHGTRILFETGLPPRYYVPQTAVRLDLLEPSDYASHCPYKGDARYWSLKIGDKVYPDIVWSYPYPLPESIKVAGFMAFYDEKVDIYVDEVLQERPTTAFG